MPHTVAKKQKRNSPKSVGHGHNIARVVDVICAKVDPAVDIGKHPVDRIPRGCNGHSLLMSVSNCHGGRIMGLSAPGSH
jgi:hypothetical protein